MTTTVKKSNPVTAESEFIDRVCQTCGFFFACTLTGFDGYTVRDFCIGHQKPRSIDMRKFIDALGKFNELTKVRSA